MAKKTKVKVPKDIMGFKLSKGTRKDIKTLLKMVGNPDKQELAVTVAGGIAAILAERFAEHHMNKRAH